VHVTHGTWDKVLNFMIDNNRKLVRFELDEVRDGKNNPLEFPCGDGAMIPGEGIAWLNQLSVSFRDQGVKRGLELLCRRVDHQLEFIEEEDSDSGDESVW
jgi:hypothetical protein